MCLVFQVRSVKTEAGRQVITVSDEHVEEVRVEN